MNVLRRVTVCLAVVGALVAARSACTPSVGRADVTPTAVSGKIELVVLNNSWVDFDVYARREAGGYQKICRAGSLTATTCQVPSHMMVGDGVVHMKIESRLWQKVHELPPVHIPQDAVRIVLRIPNHTSTVHIAGIY